jgi:hypothetical protein
MNGLTVKKWEPIIHLLHLTTVNSVAHGIHDRGVGGHELERHIAKGRANGTSRASLGTASRITNGVEHARNGPAGTENSRGNRVAQTRDQESTQEGDLVLCEVGMRTLGAVELVGLGILLSEFIGGVRDRVLEATSLAGLAGEDNVEGVDEEGGCSGNENVAVFSGELKDERHDGGELG